MTIKNYGGTKIEWHGWVGILPFCDAVIHQWPNPNVTGGYKYHVELQNPLRIEFFNNIHNAIRWAKRNA